MPSRIDHWGT
jgi:hypothetical protein